MSEEAERVYTVNLGKVLLSPDNQRAKRAVNMVKEFARHHMKIEQVKLEEDVSHLLWSRSIKHPPRKIRVRMTKTDEGYVLISKYGGEEVSTEKDEKKTKQEKIKSKVSTLRDKLVHKPAAEPESVPEPVPEPAHKPAAEPEPKPAAEPEPEPKSNDVPEFFQKKDKETKKKPKSKSKD